MDGALEREIKLVLCARQSEAAVLSWQRQYSTSARACSSSREREMEEHSSTPGGTAHPSPSPATI